MGKRGSSKKREQLKRRLMAYQDTCWLGLEPLDFTVDDPNDMRHVEIDEEIPASLGGSVLSEDNCNLVCRRHNLMKGSRVLAYGALSRAVGGRDFQAPGRKPRTSREW